MPSIRGWAATLFCDVRSWGVKGEREVRTILTEQGNAPRRRRGVDENTGRNRPYCYPCQLDRRFRRTASCVQAEFAAPR